MSSARLPSTSRLVLIPSYNTGAQLLETVRTALRAWQPVWVILDGSTDGSHDALAEIQPAAPQLRIIDLSPNRGKGGAVLAGMLAARDAGFSHALVMDADGQHPADRIPEFMELSERNPSAMILGEPEFAANAPVGRKYGRRIGNWWTNLETLWGGVCDSLFGFRVYPIEPSLRVFQSTSAGRRYDFDTLLAVRLYWLGVPPINVKVPVRYLSTGEGGISHFHYLRDNLLLIQTHFNLVLGAIVRLPQLYKTRIGP